MKFNLTSFFLLIVLSVFGQKETDPSLLTIDRIYASDEFRMDYFGQARWLESGTAYTTLEYSEEYQGASDIVKYESTTGKKKVLITAKQLIPTGLENPLPISNYIWSKDKQKLFAFLNKL